MSYIGYNDTGYASYQTAAAAYALGLRVYDNNGTVTLSGITTKNDLGTVFKPSWAANDPISVALITKPGTLQCVANGAITQGADVYTAASGKVSGTAASTSYKFGTAMSSASADGDLITVMPNPGDTAN